MMIQDQPLANAKRPKKADVERAAHSALMHGLDVLRLLIEADGPMTATEIARRIGVHKSTVSRILKTLIRAEFVRKPEYHAFAAAYGVMTLSGRAVLRFPLVTKPRQILLDMAEQSAPLAASLQTVWHEEIISFLRTQDGQIFTPHSTGFPLHLSSVGMRLLLDETPKRALEILANSRRRYGWPRPTQTLPETESELLDLARSHLRDGVLLLENWYSPGQVTASIRVDVPGEFPACLALNGPMGHFASETIRERLNEGKLAVLKAFEA